MAYDYIVVGGGAAGCILANRLSARSGNRVLLCEAGPDTPDGRVPEAILNSYPGFAYLSSGFTWSQLRVTTDGIGNDDPDRSRHLRKYEQARVLGGGSSINGQLANRGAPGDYDQWQEMGATGWGWDDVLPYFRKIERDIDCDGPLHGKEGRIPIRRIFPDYWPKHMTALRDALQSHGHPFKLDQNGDFEDGFYPATIANLYDRRVSSAIGYLDPATRLRPNLEISTGTEVTRLLFDGTRCIGVVARRDGKDVEFRGQEVILSSGAVYSPAHLLRSGIGPAADLAALGIEVVRDLPGVGRHLTDHPCVAVASFIKPEGRLDGRTQRHLLAAWRYSSNIAGAPVGDMSVSPVSRAAWHAVGRQIGSLNICVYKTYSRDGRIRLNSADWRDQPKVDFNLLSDERDLLRLMDGVRRVGRLYDTPDMRAVTANPFPAVYGEKVRQVGAVTARNKILTAIMARLLDGPEALRDILIRNVVMDAFTIEGVMNDDEECAAFVRTCAIGAWHASCSCRMGAADDPMAVVDAQGRVRGVEGLRVADASIFPDVPRANTTLPTMMVAEKISDIILGQH
ncbi:GMC family oxidoreductase [Bosea sp. (in: a-proteobacteria)]|uniref:GMC family oxidoreductase n=1 Tax=Bosea sp. (in: a-proteobacteria) TaxID=1871050 RepID=UPI002628D9B6|nr:GMC family oxidoreductase N-terminal domain-containing protein [Bosea sp. (in: a-proteobacteria)]MCO5089561.1 GMC family oxidoreductase N-terminal domain-containing protein [Bosea sp. (in: a-proteobacteria)]